MEPILADWRPTPKFQDRVARHVLLFALTIASTTLAGASTYLAFISDFAGTPAAGLPMSYPALIRLLMDRAHRDDQIKRVEPKLLAGSTLADGIARGE